MINSSSFPKTCSGREKGTGRKGEREGKEGRKEGGAVKEGRREVGRKEGK